MNVNSAASQENPRLRRSKRIQGKKVYIDEDDSSHDDAMEIDTVTTSHGNSNHNHNHKKSSTTRRSSQDYEVKNQSTAAVSNGNPGRRRRHSYAGPFQRFSSPEFPGSGCCHHCKNKKDFWVGCPFVEAHRYCDGCIERHFSISYEEFTLSPEKFWVDGCPICKVTCPCAACRRARDKKSIEQPEKSSSSSSSSKKRKREEVEDESESESSEDEDDGSAKKMAEDSKKRKGPVSKRRKGSLPSVDSKLSKQLKNLQVEKNNNNQSVEDSATSSLNLLLSATTSLLSNTQQPTRTSPRRKQTPTGSRRNSFVKESNGYYEIPADLGVEALVGLVGAAEALSRRPSFTDVKRRTEYLKLIAS